MATPQTTTATTYNPSELAILQSLDADTTSFKGRHFRDPVCLTGHNNSGPAVLNLTGAVFHEEAIFSLTNWSKVVLNGARFRKGVSFRCTTMDRMYARGVHISEFADFMDVTTASADFTNARLPETVWTRESDALHQILAVRGLLMDARSGSNELAAPAL